MQIFGDLPWYGYVLAIIGIGAYAYNFYMKRKNPLYDEDMPNVKFRKDANSNLSAAQIFSMSLDAVTNEWWEANTNTLAFKKGIRANNYLEGWGIDTKEGYWELTNYFIGDGRRWYFDFIYNMMKHEPKENWDNLMTQKFGDNERAQRYLNLLSSGKAQITLQQQGIFTYDDTELEIGVAAYDVSVLVGHARRAYTANIISEQDAWKVITFATNLAKENFSSWEAFGKSYILGFTLDIRDRNDGFLEEMYHLYKQVKESPESPWQLNNWPIA